MYYKVLKNDKVIDVLDDIAFGRYQAKHDIILSTDEQKAEVFLGSDGNTWLHDSTLRPLPDGVTKYDTVERVEIDVYEYEQLKTLNYKTPEEIVDAYTLELIERGII